MLEERNAGKLSSHSCGIVLSLEHFWGSAFGRVCEAKQN